MKVNVENYCHNPVLILFSNNDKSCQGLLKPIGCSLLNLFKRYIGMGESKIGYRVSICGVQ